MASNPYETQLMKIGLSDKEARVYIAALELGPASVQKIAQKAGVKRATTYVAIEGLIDRGLVSTSNKEKKRYFAAESPKMLFDVLEEEKKTISSKQDALTSLLPDLIALGSVAGKRPQISFFEGVEGLRVIHEDVLSTRDKRLENIVSLDDAMKVQQTENYVSSFREKLDKKGTQVRILYSSADKPLQLPAHLEKRWTARRIPNSLIPIHGELTLYGDKVAAFSYRGKIFGTIIESAEIATTLRVLFEMAWGAAQKE